MFITAYNYAPQKVEGNTAQFHFNKGKDKSKNDKFFDYFSHLFDS